MTDLGFPAIRYDSNHSPRQWGQMHGESFRGAIRELVSIRAGLMREKNPALTAEHIQRLATQQWAQTKRFDGPLAEELVGICDGAQISIAEMVILNNYTDFRDIQVSDQGCSTVCVSSDRRIIAGQTWDMHGSAKRYVCCLEVPVPASGAQLVVFSIVGCVGMMGYATYGSMVGVNNMNTDGAQPGILWPVLVRKLLLAVSLREMAETLTTADISSGRGFLLAWPDQAEMWEVLPGLSERIGTLSARETGALFHTNHCLGQQTRLREVTAALSSTTHVRIDLLEKKIDQVRTFEELNQLLNDHENYPMSICSNYQSGAQDPSITCGGAVGDLASGQIEMWRGDRLYDHNAVIRSFTLRTGQAA